MKEKQPNAKKGKLKTILIVIAVLLVIGAVSSPSDSENAKQSEQSSNAPNGSSSTIAEPPAQPQSAAPMEFTLIAGEKGEYGKEVVYNQGTDLEERIFAYFIPAGNYKVTNAGDYTSQVNVYSDEVVVTDAGWEEPAQTFAVELLDVGESADISIGSGQHIEIAAPSIFTFTAIQ